MAKTTIITLLLILSFLLQACSKEDSSQANTIIINKNEFVLTALDNKQYVVKKEVDGYSLEGAKGKVVIFDIFATWCPPCRATAPHLTSLKRKFSKDLVIIGVTIEDDLPNQKLADFRHTYDANYILVNSLQNRRLVNSMAGFLKLGNNFPIPIMAIFKDGKLVKHYLGLVEEEFVESDIKRALGH
jgi:thiol-disulfide isomerase/thioredoxin